MRTAETASEAIEAVGGTGVFAKWWGVSPANVSIWRKRGFPADKHAIMSARLRDDHRITVSPSAWNQEGA